MNVVDSKYEIGQSVYLKTDPSQLERLVFCIRVYKNELLYELACGVTTSNHYDFEITTEKDVVKATGE